MFHLQRNCFIYKFYAQHFLAEILKVYIIIVIIIIIV